MTILVIRNIDMPRRKMKNLMKKIMMIDKQEASIEYDPDIGMFRGEFLNLSGGADFYATDMEGLKREGHRSLKVYLKMCKEKGIIPYPK